MDTYTVTLTGAQLAIINTALESYLDEQPGRDDIAAVLAVLEAAPANE